MTPTFTPWKPKELDRLMKLAQSWEAMKVEKKKSWQNAQLKQRALRLRELYRF